MSQALARRLEDENQVLRTQAAEHAHLAKYQRGRLTALQTGVETLKTQSAEQARLAAERLDRLTALETEAESLKRQLAEQTCLVEDRLAQVDALAKVNQSIRGQLAEGRAEIERWIHEAQMAENDRERSSQLAARRQAQLSELQSEYLRIEAQLYESDRRIYDLSSRLHTAGQDSAPTALADERLSSELRRIIDRLSRELYAASQDAANGDASSTSHTNALAECLAYMAEADRKIYELSAKLEARRLEKGHVAGA